MSKNTWNNKIIGHEEVPPEQLLAHPENWRIHPAYQQKALQGVINDIGYIKSVTVNKRTGRVVDGHLRVTLALRDNIPTIPVEYVDLTEEEEAEALLTIDPIAALAGADKTNLETLLSKVNTDDAAVMEFLEEMEGEIIGGMEHLKEYDMEIKPRKRIHALISFDVDDALEIKDILDALDDARFEVLYGGN